MSLGGRSLTLIHTYSTSPFSWYTKRLRDAYSSAYIAFTIAAEKALGNQYQIVRDVFTGYAVLDQLFPVDASGRLLEHGISKSALGRLLSRTRLKKDFSSPDPDGSQIREQAMNAAAGTPFPTTPVPQSSVSSAAGPAPMPAFQSSGNIFEDFDAIMADPVWSPGMSGMENPYGQWV